METENVTYSIASLQRMVANYDRGLEVATVSELSERNVIFVEDGNHGENRPRQDEFAATGIAFLRPPDLKDGRVDFQNCGRINDAGFKRVRKGIGQRGDIILTHRATVGRIAITDDDAPEVFVTNPGTTVWRSTDASVLDQRYLYCFMRSAAFMDQLWSQVGNNSTFDYVSLTQQRGLRVAFPPLSEQKAIASVLGALDDKIEFNRRMNETLETLAKSLFKSWFMDATQSALPKGWREGKVSDLATLSRDGLNPGDFPAESFDHYSLPAFDEGRTPKPERGDTIMSNKFIVPPDCVMVSKLNPRIPRIWLPDMRGSNRAVCSTEFLVATPKPGVSREFLYCLFINESFVSVFTTMVTGTSGSHQRVRPESLLNMNTPLPPAS